MNEINWKTEILPVLEKIRDKGVNIDLLRNLFIEKLDYDFSDQLTNIKFRESIKGSILSTKIIAEKDEFKVIFCQIDTLLKGKEPEIVKDISAYYPANIIILTNREADEAHFINTKYVGKKQDKKVKGFRRITVGKTDRLRTAAERLTKIYADTGISTLTLMQKCVDAFDVEAVSVEFYKEFVEKYKLLRKIIQKTNNLTFEIADNLTQNILNRLLFLYFVQKKGWLNDDYKFLYNNFKSNGKEYYKDFLVPLFKKLSDKDFSAQGFENIPFLNGGLFEFQEIKEDISIPNSAFDEIFDNLLEHFNFTIREDIEFEEEVAIDPEMLGRIFEELILSVESAEYKDIPDPRRESGSYYTPRFIVSFMVKQSLLNYLTNELPEIPKDKLKSLIFNSSADGIENPGLVKEKLLSLKIVDPGVGSGAFPVDILNKLVQIIEVLNKKLGISEDRFNLRKKLIENCIYGVDIQDRAVHIARLRLWLSLIVDLEVEKIKDIPPLINLDFKIIKGNSLISKICGFKFDLNTPKQSDQKILELIEKFKELKDKYAETNTDTKKRILKEKINKIKCDITIWHLENIKKKCKEEFERVIEGKPLFEKTEEEITNGKNKIKLEEKIREKISSIENKIEQIKETQKIDAFNWHLDFFEVMGIKGGFDIVIANPPYGVDVDREVYQDEFRLGSKDSYGVFTTLGMDILKPGGTLCYIMSDTWQTIRTHYNLREKLFEETETQYLISVPMRTFKATVNTGIYLFKKQNIIRSSNSSASASSIFPVIAHSFPRESEWNEATKQPLQSFEKDNFIIAADFHNLDIKKGDLEAAFDLIVGIEQDEKCEDGYTIISDREMAIYAYKQKIIGNFSNLSFFIASPKLFKLMQDMGNLKPKVLTDEKGDPVMFDVKKPKNLFEQEGPNIYEVNFNEKTIELVKFGGIAEVKQGLSPVPYNKYLRQLPNTKGSNYQEIDLNLVLKEDELEKIRNDEKLRMDVIENGICTNPEHKTHQHRYFGGRYFIPYDKGGASDIEEGWLPNYYVLTPYFIDWSEETIKRMRKDRNVYIRNEEYYFKQAVTFSHTGQYSPTFRIGAGGPFDVAGSSLFLDQKQEINQFLGTLNSKICKYFLKVFINHSVNMSEDPIKQIPTVFNLNEERIQLLENYVNQIIQHQKQDPRYDYMTNEQVEIDKLVYEMYNLDEEDIQEVENWYFRRYPKLAKVIEDKLNGKDNDGQ
jgi:hypothetical protein